LRKAKDFEKTPSYPQKKKLERVGTLRKLNSLVVEVHQGRGKRGKEKGSQKTPFRHESHGSIKQ